MNEMEKTELLEKELEAVKERNKRVEADKAWETSGFRIGMICVITYLTASAVLFLIGIKDFYLGALVPVVGFFLSTLSLPAVKEWWIRKRLK
ncbi:MAG TPA: hypothetical protein VI588_02410 [Candidatus Gracilibacteria bacterium]|nr:hypothetical protein [Candidatus Gracilibacteria bacterium]